MKFFYLGCLILITCACSTISTVRYDIYSTNLALQKDSKLADDKVSENLQAEGIFFGVSDNQLGRRAWLLRLKKGEGILYMPPNNLAIRQLEISPTGQISFQSDAGLGNRTYSFEGQFVSNNIQGKFSFSPIKGSNEKIDNIEVSLQKIDISSLNKKNIFGLYSNVEYVEEGGDLVGADLILLPHNEELVGAFTSYENEMIPYALNIKQLGNKVKFKINTENEEQDFEGVISSNKLTLWYKGKNIDPQAKPDTLFKKQSLLNILTKAGKF